MSYKEENKFKSEVLQSEITILSSKINGTVDRLWKIRGLSITLWSASVAIGLGATTGNKDKIPELLWVSAFLPLLFWWIDATYNSWYCRFVIREREISKYLNCEKYNLPGEDFEFNSSELLGAEKIKFPIFDQGGHETFNDSKWFSWKVGKFHSFADTRPIIIFGGQVLISTILILQHEKICIYWSGACFLVLIVLVVVNQQRDKYVEKAYNGG